MKISPQFDIPHIIVLVCFVALSIFAYGLSLDAALVFDSTGAITDNAAIQIDGLTFDQWRTAALSFDGSPLGRPLVMLSFALNHVLAGDSYPFYFKATNLALHCGVALAVYSLIRNIFVWSPALRRPERQARFIALGATLIWLLHPLHVSTVLYVVQRMTQLSVLFVVIGLAYFVRCRGQWAAVAPASGAVVASLLWLMLATVAAVLSKENGVLLLWLIAVSEVCLYRGVWAGTHNRGLKWLGYFALLLPLFAVGVLIALGAMPFMGGYENRTFDVEQRLLTQTRVLWHYFFWIVLPNIQSMGLHHDDIGLSRGMLQPVSTMFSIAAWLLCILVALILRVRYPALLFGLLFFLVSHAVESSVLPLELVWEHRNYLPSVGICIVLAISGHDLLLNLSQRQSGAIAISILLLLSALLFARTDRWSDELSLSRANLVNHPESLRSNYHYANTLFRQYNDSADDDRNPQALLASRHHYERMYQLDPMDVSALVSLYFLDQQFFPELQEQVDWFAILERVVASRAFSYADFNALELLVTCLSDNSCERSQQDVVSFFTLLLARFPHNARLNTMQVRYLESRVGDISSVVGGASMAPESNSDMSPPYLEQVQRFNEEGEPGKALLVIAFFMANDPHRTELQRVKYLLRASN